MTHKSEFGGGTMKGELTMTLEGLILAEIVGLNSVAYKTKELAAKLGASEGELRAFSGKNVGGVYKCEVWPGESSGFPERMAFEVVDAQAHQKLLDRIRAENAKIRAEKAKPTQKELAAAAHEQDSLRESEFLTEVGKHIDKSKRAAHLAAMRADASVCVVASSISIDGDTASAATTQEPEPHVAAKLAQELQASERKRGIVLSMSEALNRVWPKRSQVVDKFSAVPQRQRRGR